MKFLLSTIAALSMAAPAMARDNVQVAGSSTVLPYASIVAEAFGENFEFPTPVVESGGSSAGLKRFCEGVGTNTVDIANSSRPIKSSEIEACAENGVTDIMEVRIGYDGIVFASDIDGFQFAFTPEEIWLAATPAFAYETWNQINPAYPAQPIMVFIPGTKHGTREVFEDEVLLVGCESYLHRVTPNAEMTDEQESACIDVRSDGLAVDIDGDYTETLARIGSNPNGIGVFGLAFYEQNTSTLQVSTMSGVVPNTETISTGEYPVSEIQGLF